MSISSRADYLKIDEICRPGRSFTFQIGIDRSKLDGLMHRVAEAYARFASAPIAPEVASDLQKIVLVSSIHATNSIEGGLLEEQEVKKIIESTAVATSAEATRRVLNLKEALIYVENLLVGHEVQKKLQLGLWGALGQKPVVEIQPFRFTEAHIKELHRITMADLMPKFELGNYRNRTRQPIKVSDAEHGGTYVPPLCPEDIERLMRHLIDWLNSEPLKSLPVWYTAPLLHFYFERIHPFKDGNGRVGRILEAIHLRLGIGKFASYGIWQYYWENIDKYFNVFNLCGKAEKSGDEYPNTAFVEFFLTGMLVTINRLQDEANKIIARAFFKNHLIRLIQQKKLNRRQYAIVTELSSLVSIKRAELSRLSWYEGLYDKLTKQTKSRDLRELQALNLIIINDQDEIKLLEFDSGILLSQHPDTQPN